MHRVWKGDIIGSVRIPILPLMKDQYGVGFEWNKGCDRYFAFGTLNSIGIGFGCSKYVSPSGVIDGNEVYSLCVNADSVISEGSLW